MAKHPPIPPPLRKPGTRFESSAGPFRATQGRHNLSRDVLQDVVLANQRGSIKPERRPTRASTRSRSRK